MQERSFGARAARTLRRELKEQGVHASVDAEPVFGTRKWRFVVCAARYRTMNDAERRDFTWSAVRHALSGTDARRVEGVVTMTPSEREPWRRATTPHSLAGAGRGGRFGSRVKSSIQSGRGQRAGVVRARMRASSA
jgi:hypothetical protein